ncbi:MAG: site-specific integrase [Actinobacteria bacterium]|nr:site-specific integrase [Actinomycetota bacterium]
MRKRRDKRVRRDPVTGFWGFHVWVPDPARPGKLRQVHRSRKSWDEDAANAALAELLEAAGARGPLPGSRGATTLAAYLTDLWLPWLEGTDASGKTKADYASAVKCWLAPPPLGGIVLEDLRPVDVDLMAAGMARAGRSANTQRAVLNALGSALGQAVQWGMLSRSRNPMPDVRKPAAVYRHRAWNAGQMTAFLHAVADTRLEVLWRLIIVTSCRRGEAAGLLWADMTDQAVSFTRVKGGGPGRAVHVDAQTAAMLRKWRAVQLGEFMKLGIRPGDYMFTSESGRPVKPEWITDEFARICAAAGLPNIGVHGLRHSSASWLLNAGINPKLVSQRLGHKSIQTTHDIYNSVMPVHDQAAVEALAAALDIAKSGADVTDSVTGIGGSADSRRSERRK